jgi:serine/threonine protein kinase/tetratricopeptide (TPR) repeat protein
MSPSKPCPELSQLQAFSAGTLDDDEAAIVAEHLDECSVCEQKLTELECGSGTLLEGLRQLPDTDSSGSADAFSNEPELGEAVRRMTDESEANRSGSGSGGEGDTVDDANDPLLGARFGAYQIEQLIGKGGMGRVYRARRVDYEQTVALKVVRRDVGGEELAKRFKKEISLQARVSQHPNIAGLIDAGVTEDHQPYLAMEYVPGVPIDQFCNEKERSLRERLQLFVKVCSAVAYAHKLLVIHRDLKPSNILVTDEDEPWLVDFGIAKEQQAPDVTVTHFQAFTPEYASPEQVRGEPLTTATDVYSLGVVLYKLVTGTKPYEIKGLGKAEAERLICEVDPPKPSQRAGQTTTAPYTPPESQDTSTRAHLSPSRLRRQLVGDLDAILLKALEKQPDDRYASVADLAADINRYLAGEPVEATHRTVFYVMLKFIRRNRLAMASASAIVISLIVATVITTAGLLAARKAEAEARGAEAQAQAYFDLTAKTFEGFLEHLDRPDLREDPRAQELRTDLARRISDVFGNLQSEGKGDVSKQLATVRHLLGVAAIYAGRPEDALPELEAGLALRERLVEASPADLDLQRQRAISYGMIGRMHRANGDADKAEASLTRACTLFEQLVAVAPHDQTYQSDLVKCYDQLMLSQRSFRSLQSALATTEKEGALAVKLAEQYPDEEDVLTDLVVHYINASAIHTDSGDYDAALRDLESARPVAEKLLQMGSGTKYQLKRLATVDNNLALIYHHMGKFEEADAAFQRAIDAGRRLLVSPLDRDLADTFKNYADLEADRQQHSHAAALLEEAADIAQTHLDADQTSLQNRFEFHVIKRRLAEVLLKQGKADDALPLLEACAATFDDVASRIQAQPILREQALCGLALAQTWLQLERLDQIESRLDTSRDVLQRLLQAQPENVLLRANLAQVLNVTSIYFGRAGNAGRAIELAEQAVREQTQSAAIAGDDTRMQEALREYEDRLVMLRDQRR